MTIDAYVVIATGRARGLSERAIARQLGLRDGETAYGLSRMDSGAVEIKLAPPTKPAPKKYRLISDGTMARAGRLAASAADLRRRLERSEDLAREIEETAARVSGLKPKPRRLTIDDVMAAVCAAFDVTETQIRLRSNAKMDTWPRHAFCHLAMKYAHGASLTKVGYYLDGRDHTTALNGRRKAETLCRLDPDWRAKYDKAEAALLAGAAI